MLVFVVDTFGERDKRILDAYLNIGLHFLWFFRFFNFQGKERVY